MGKPDTSIHSKTASSPTCGSSGTDNPQFSWKALITGCLFGLLVAAINLYMGLKTGITMNGSLIVAVVTFGFFRYIFPKLQHSILETNIAQTAGSAAGSMASTAGLLTAIPALQMLGYQFHILHLILWSLALAFVGLFFSVPLREHLRLGVPLKFPTGTATAETLVSLYTDAHGAQQKFRSLLLFFIVGALLALIAVVFPQVYTLRPPLWLGGAALVALGFGFCISPLLFGVGMIVGPGIGLSVLLGTFIAWGGLAPLAFHLDEFKEISDLSYRSPQLRSWILWPGVSMMVTDTFVSLLFLAFKTIRATRRLQLSGQTVSGFTPKLWVPTFLSFRWWFIGFSVSVGALCLAADTLFDIPFVLTLVAVAVSYLLALVAGRSVGESDFNPAGGLGKITQLIFSGLAPGSLTTNLLAASITAAGARQSGDMLQDLKTGEILKGDPKKQFLAQALGVVAGSFVVVPVYFLLEGTFPLGGEFLPAPAAMAWKTMAMALTRPLNGLPDSTWILILVFGALGGSLALIRNLHPKAWCPSGVSTGLAFLVPAYFGVTVGLGALSFSFWRHLSAQSCKKLAYTAAAGLIIGEGTTGLLSTGGKLLFQLVK